MHEDMGMGLTGDGGNFWRMATTWDMIAKEGPSSLVPCCMNCPVWLLLHDSVHLEIISVLLGPGHPGVSTQ